jgi:RNA polymerase sigma-70 factor (ECF subfamily)
MDEATALLGRKTLCYHRIQKKGPWPERAERFSLASRGLLHPLRAEKRITYRQDDDILEGLRACDPAALEALYDRYARQAFGLAYRVLGDGAAAEDAVQEAFLALWQQSARLDASRGRLGALLMTIVYRRAIDMVRARRGQTTLDESVSPAAMLQDEEAAPFDFDKEMVRRALMSLPEEQRRAIEMCFFEGFTHVEAAARLGIPLGTLKSRLRLALEKLRQALRGQG